MYETKDELPKTLEEAVNVLLSALSEEDKEALKNTPEEDLITLHHGLGTYIRNEFDLWTGNDRLLKSCGSQMMGSNSPYADYLGMMVQPDDASMEIIEATWRALQGK